MDTALDIQWLSALQLVANNRKKKENRKKENKRKKKKKKLNEQLMLNLQPPM